MDIPTIDAGLLLQARTRPDALAFTHNGHPITFGELAQWAGHLAHELYGLGVRPGDHVPIIEETGIQFVKTFYAVVRLGAVPCVMNPGAPDETIARRAARIRPKLVIRPGTLKESKAGFIEAADTAGDDVAFLQLTSGTSGEPRAAVVLQRNVAAQQAMSNAALRITSDDILVSWVPPWHDLGLVRFILTPMFTGAACHLVTPSMQSIPQWLATIASERGTVTGAPDFAWRLAARLGDANLDLSSLRFATNGGEPVRKTTIDAFEQRYRLHNVIRPGYGLAEATLGVTYTRPGEDVHVDERGNVSCGRPAEGVEVKIAGDGEILVRGPVVFAGYFDAEEATREKLRDGWLHTGDTGYLDAAGRLYVLGRKRSLLKRGGAIIAPRELEEAAQSAGGVRIAAAVALSPSEARATESIVIVIEPEPGKDAEAVAANVAQSIRKALGFAPERVIAVQPRTIPITYNGKIRHDVLRAQLAEGALADRIVLNAPSDREFAD